MEPWPFSHGYYGQPPKFVVIQILQWSHGPSAMDTPEAVVWVDVVPAPSMEPWPFSHGYLMIASVSGSKQCPSMEPWPFSHGYIRSRGGRRWRPVPFNGAMALQPWIRPQRRRSALRRIRPFNGAMALQPWIRRIYGTALLVMVTLQWSHGPSAMDTFQHPHRLKAAVKPSMEPWPFSHGYHGWRPQLRHVVEPFNGAMALQPWIRRRPRRLWRGGQGPSMEPWPFSHGYRSSCVGVSRMTRLQWSHGPSAMDTSSFCTHIRT